MAFDLLLLASFAPVSLAQAADDATAADQQRVVAIETKLNELNDALSQTEKMLEKSRAEIQALHAQLDALRAQTAATSSSVPASDAQNANTDHPQELEALREQQDAMQAEIKQHDQTKVETFSKYPLRLSGLILFNAFSNAGVVDDTELPTIALSPFSRRIPWQHGRDPAADAADARCHRVPELGEPAVPQNVSIDFFGGVSSNTYGYSSSAGLVRMRQSWVNLDWYKTTVQAGYTTATYLSLIAHLFRNGGATWHGRLGQSLDLVTPDSSRATYSPHRTA